MIAIVFIMTIIFTKLTNPDDQQNFWGPEMVLLVMFTIILILSIIIFMTTMTTIMKSLTIIELIMSTIIILILSTCAHTMNAFIGRFTWILFFSILSKWGIN